MKFDMSGAPKAPFDGVRVGDIFAAKGGARSATGERVTYWLVMVANPQRVHLAGLSADGQMLTTTSYAAHVLDDRKRLGFCREIADLADINLSIEWESNP